MNSAIVAMELPGPKTSLIPIFFSFFTSSSAMMPPAPEGAPDPFAPEQVAPVVAWLASPASEHVNGYVFITYGGRLAVLAAPTVERVYRTAGDIWSAEELASTVGAAIADGEHAGFAVSTALRID